MVRNYCTIITNDPPQPQAEYNRSRYGTDKHATKQFR